MTVTAIPPRTARPRLAPYTAASGDMVLPGCYGVSRGQGITGELIRHATGPRPGHAFIYIGNGRIVEVAPPTATRTPASAWCRACGISARSARPAWTRGRPSPPDAGFSPRPAGRWSRRLTGGGRDLHGGAADRGRRTGASPVRQGTCKISDL